MICAMMAAATMQLQPMVPLKTLREVQAVNSRAVCTARGFEVIGGVTNVVETWRRGNFTWSVTNVARSVMGKVQTNTFQERLAEWKSKYDAKAAIVQTAVSLLLARRAVYVRLRDAAVLPTTKSLYQNVIDDIDEQLSAMGETPPGD